MPIDGGAGEPGAAEGAGPPQGSGFQINITPLLYLSALDWAGLVPDQPARGMDLPFSIF